MPLTDVQWVLGHAHLSTTQRYLNPVTEDVIAGVLAFHARQRDRDPAAPPAAGYRAGEPADPLRRGPVVTAGAAGDRRREPPMPRRAVTGSANPTGAQLAASFPPRPVASSWPATEASRSAVLARVLSAPFALDNRLSQQTRRLGVLAVLGWLRPSPATAGSSGGRPAARRTSRTGGPVAGRHADPAPKPPPHLSPGLLVLICADVIRPSLDWLLRFAPARHSLAVEMARTRDPSVRSPRSPRCARSGRVGLQSQQQALTNVAIIMAAKGGPVAAGAGRRLRRAARTVARTRATTARHAQQPAVLSTAARARRPRSRCARRDRDVLRPWTAELRGS